MGHGTLYSKPKQWATQSTSGSALTRRCTCQLLGLQRPPHSQPEGLNQCSPDAASLMCSTMPQHMTRHAAPPASSTAAVMLRRCASQPGAPPGELQLGDGRQVDVVGAVCDAQRARAGPQARQRGVVRHACARRGAQTLTTPLPAELGACTYQHGSTCQHAKHDRPGVLNRTQLGFFAVR